MSDASTACFDTPLRTCLLTPAALGDVCGRVREACSVWTPGSVEGQFGMRILASNDEFRLLVDDEFRLLVDDEFRLLV